jgi:hypothetical protein
MEHQSNESFSPEQPHTPFLAVPAPASETANLLALVKLTLRDSWQTARTAIKEPATGVQRAWEELPEQRRLPVAATHGVALILAFAIGLGGVIQSVVGAMRGLLVSALGMFGELIPAFQLTAVQRIGLAFLAALLITSFALSSMGLRKVFRVKGTRSADFFVATLATLPLTLFLIPVGFLGVSSPFLVIPLATLAVCYSVLLLYGGFRGVAKFPEVRAAIAIPATYIVADVFLYFGVGLMF